MAVDGFMEENLADTLVLVHQHLWPEKKKRGAKEAVADAADKEDGPTVAIPQSRLNGCWMYEKKHAIR